MKESIILIGMPGCGKSTLGILLAKELGMDFLDTDVAIQVRTGKTLQQTVDQSGYLKLRQIEEQILLTENIDSKVVSTGGSAIYSASGMKRLKASGCVIFLDVPLNEICQRITNYATRGIACVPGQSFEALYYERHPLYVQQADYRIDCSGKDLEQTLAEVLRYRLSCKP